ncbi:MAG: HEAT repeat domain-containing protein [Saprospiraceae bacterium]|nr:HEAT repeat domain-containing protein [Saprospiraceae bacterium]
MHDEKAEPDFPSHWLVAHEAAHHWWGDFISYRDWTQTWLSESFATFSEYLYSNHLYGAEEGALNLFNKKNAYLNEAKGRYQRPIVFERWENPDQNFDRHTYEKGALVLNMLRDYLGEPMFKRVLYHFLSKHAYQAVDTHDFMKSVLEVTGQNLDWFFDEWIFSAGHPILDIHYEWKDQQIVLNITQTQDTTQYIPIFKMPVKIAITTEKGTETKEVWLREQQQTFTFGVASKPLMVRFDPEYVLLKEWTFQKSKAELLFQAKNDNTLGRLWAMQELAAHLDDVDVLNFLKSQAKSDTFWAVRREALQTLAQAKSFALTPTLQAALQDEYSRVRALATTLLGDSKQANLHDLYKKLYETDPSYLVQAEAIRALGKLKRPAEQAFFEKVSKEKSPRNLLRNAANWALEQLKK